MLITKSKKSHNIGESLIQPSILCAAELVLGKECANKLSQISLSNDTVKGRIDELSQDIKDQTLDQEYKLSWDSMVEVCTDGAPAMLGLQSGFVTKNIDDKREAWQFIRNPFHCDVADIADKDQEEFLEFKFNSTAQKDLTNLDLETFWVKYLPVYSLISRQALRILTMFGSTYLCETVFSTLVANKTKYKNSLNVE
ncbi:hypothetical protein Pcinc_033168 [Petrolisthes cinctipes]|uniref:HAT C-terminal dimerisation domain-containing protein n=1 Tax=Petrolisthes cinctipes TaxID=88211 RepID=A0AAE1K285_PETCI|nr:hypothetical protein Pcinc_033168 [Petrolisthes cinctipes]